MNKLHLLALILLVPIFSAAAGDKRSVESRTIKNKTAQAKIVKHHEHNWRQTNYRQDVTLFKCYDSWDHKLHGRFTHEQQYLIELGGGSCYQLRHHAQNYRALQKISAYDFPLNNVHQAIKVIEHEYGLHSARLIEAEKINAGSKSFKYTLVFKTLGHQYREFRVKHNRWSGQIRQIHEV